MKTLLRTLVSCAIIIGAGYWAVQKIYETEPEAERNDAVARTVMLVEVVPVETGNFRPTLRVLGTVEAAREMTLSPRVSGPIVEISDSFIEGDIVAEGETLVTLDRSDYRNVVAQRRAALDAAEADVVLEEGRRAVAEDDLALLDNSIPQVNRELVLREPQRLSAESSVESARAALHQAELELARTRVSAPFDALVMERNADLGSQVGPGSALGRLVATDVYWVVANVAQASLQWLTFPASDAEPIEVRVTSRSAWPEGTERTGHLTRVLGELDPETRLARVLVEVPDPLATSPANDGAPTMLIGSFVEVEIPAQEFTDVARIPRELIREGGTTWVMVDRTLSVRELEIAFEDAEYAYVTGGIELGEMIVTTTLRTVQDGAPLRLEGDPEPDPSELPPPRGRP